MRYGVQDLAKELIEKTNLPFFTSPMGKSAIDEEHPNFSGCYIGSVSVDSVKDLFESADFVLNVGSLKSDFNTGSFVSTAPMPKIPAINLCVELQDQGGAFY